MIEALQSFANEWLIGRLIVGLLVAARLAGMLTAIPSLTFGLSMRMKALLIVMMTVLLVPNASIGVSSDAAAPVDIAFAAVGEFLFGMVVGGVVQLLLTGMQLAGELIAGTSGMQLSTMADPASGEPMPQLPRLIGVFVTALLFGIGGHRFLIDALLSSFHRRPLMSVSFDARLLDVLIDQLAIGMESGVRVAAPVLACVLITHLAVAIVSRTIPQLNVLALGMNLNALGILLVMALTIGSAGLIFEHELTAAIGTLGVR
ncbi:MAG: flagellar biosynthetic protein FliR [Planctomycetota bacterium]